MDPERRTALLDVKLGALARDAFGVSGGAPSPFPGGAALLAGGVLHVLLEERARSIGPALALGHHLGATHVRVLAVDGAGRLAAQAAAFADPPDVFWLQGTELHAATPEALAEAAPPPDAPQLAALMAAAGLDVVAEDGRIAGELRGLEVARVRAADDGGEPVLQVGVGQADRELTEMLHGGLAPDAALARVVEVVDAVRRPGAAPHPLGRLVPERWLRWVMRGEPGRIGATAPIEPMPAPTARRGLRERDIACATTTIEGGRAAVVVCSVGVDVDLVPAAAEARSHLDPGAALLLVVPDRDLHRTTTTLAAALVRPARIISVEGDWRSR